MIRRYLRIYYLQPDGQLVGDDSVVSNVLMPATLVPGTRLRAGRVAYASAQRRSAAASALATEATRSKRPRFVGVALVLCELARSGEGKVSKRFVSSFAVLGRDQSILLDDLDEPTLDRMTTTLTARMTEILRERKARRKTP